jgi:hypothetical protein
MNNFNLIIETCNEKTRSSGDPECSSETEIDEWLYGKTFQQK